ncbi:MAG: Ti-type conjugative transfer relaxase TraA [Phyllobacteriaceae bacterium]|nr:Ti-type conjugative transfer relaxase TraA [Phyllobacteriaceae bacterium]
MAIFHASMKPISRASGRSAVAAAAYRAATHLVNERDGVVHDYTGKRGVSHAEIVLPKGADAAWARDRSLLWNEAERKETRRDARVAREVEVSLPHELSADARKELAQEFAQHIADRYGVAVDVAIHVPHDEMDERNHHAHLLMTTRVVSAEGLGEKTDLERQNKWLLSQGRATTQMQVKEFRQSWETLANTKLAAAGLDVRIDHRSHEALGLGLEPTRHVGVHATQLARAGREVSRARLDAEAFQRNAELIRQKPDEVLALLTNEKSVFDRRDVARVLHRYVDDVLGFQNAFAAVMASPLLVELQAERKTEEGKIEPARYSTREMVDLEGRLADAAERLSADTSHRVAARRVARAIEHQDEAIRKAVASDCSGKVTRGEMTTVERDRRVARAGLSAEQQQAIEHVTGPRRIAAVVGFAGAGKSTMLAAAREAWEAEGRRVFGAALAGKAAEGLEESAGIRSRTLASWERRWAQETDLLEKGDVLVVDEAGMVGSRQLAGFVEEVDRRGAKLVLVGDHEQLQAIAAGAPFRAIAEQVGHIELQEIRRQREDWQRAASVAFATHRTAEGLRAYAERGAVRFDDTRESARSTLVVDYLADRDADPNASRVAMAHRRVDVRAINEEIRAALQERGELARSRQSGLTEDKSSPTAVQERPQAFIYQTNDGEREFAVGDRIVFLENDRDLGVKNGMLGTVETVEPDRLVARLDGAARAAGSGDFTRAVSVSVDTYNAIDHGYATTIHKLQGATVDRAFVLASGTMDRHLTYVAMTRHRSDVRVYAGAEEFADRRVGVLVEHGRAPYENKPANRDSYFVTLENPNGERHTIWGVDLARAIREAKPEVGERIRLEHLGKAPIPLPDGTVAERNGWKVHRAEELLFDRLVDRLSRSGAKENTLDYGRDFADRRGIAARLGIVSEIVVSKGASKAMAAAAPVGELVPAAPAKEVTMDDMFGRFDRGEVPVTWTAAIDRVRSHVARDLVLAYRDPQALQARIDDLVARRRFDDVQPELDRTAAAPELAGGLNGATGWFGKIDEPRKAAQLAVSRLAKIGALFFEARSFIESEYREQVRSANVRGARSVPMPSPELRAALAEKKPIEGKLADEITTIRAAVERRFTPEERRELWSGDIERIRRVVPEGTDLDAIRDLAAPIEMQGREVESQRVIERFLEDEKAEDVGLSM